MFMVSLCSVLMLLVLCGMLILKWLLFVVKDFEGDMVVVVLIWLIKVLGGIFRLDVMVMFGMI